jgi:hypothetical protein
MPLGLLHDYRHAYKLASPSAYSRPSSKLLLSSGIGLQSPTAIAARRTQLAASKRASDREERGKKLAAATESDLPEAQKVLHQIIRQGRVSKEQLALAVRRHFNSAGLLEQEAIARFLYKVREEGKGREFRLRFQP